MDGWMDEWFEFDGVCRAGTENGEWRNGFVFGFGLGFDWDLALIWDTIVVVYITFIRSTVLLLPLKCVF